MNKKKSHGNKSSRSTRNRAHARAVSSAARVSECQTGPTDGGVETTIEPVLTCDVCCKEVPRSEALSAEATDYVYYFCGPDCYGKWKAEAGSAVGESGRDRGP